MSLFETLAIVTVRHMYMTEFKGKHKTDYTQFFFLQKTYHHQQQTCQQTL